LFAARASGCLARTARSDPLPPKDVARTKSATSRSIRFNRLPHAQSPFKTKVSPLIRKCTNAVEPPNIGTPGYSPLCMYLGIGGGVESEPDGHPPEWKCGAQYRVVDQFGLMSRPNQPLSCRVCCMGSTRPDGDSNGAAISKLFSGFSFSSQAGCHGCVRY